MTRKYLENAGETVSTALPKGDYDIEIVDAHPNPKGGPSIFLDLKVLNGPEVNRVVGGVSLYVPPEGKSLFYFNQQIRAFAGAIRAVDWSNVDDDDELAVMAQALIGLKATASLSVQGDDAGQYAGSQQIDSTKPLEGAQVEVAPAAPTTIAAAPAVLEAAAPAPVVAPAPQQQAVVDVPAPVDVPF